MNIKNAYLSSAIAFCLIMLLIFPLYGQTYTLQYKFIAGDQYQYKTESKDSTSGGGGGMFGSETGNLAVTTWSLQTVVVANGSSGQSFQLTITTDSTWSDRAPREFTQRPEGGFPDGGEPPAGGTFSRGDRTAGGGGFTMGMMSGMGRGSRVTTMEINTNGKPIAQNTVPSPLFVVLPDKPVAINDTWNYETTIAMEGRQTGTMKVQSQALLYDVADVGDSKVAMILVTSVSTSEGELSMGGGDQQMTGAFSNASEGTSLVQFDINKGRILEIVTEQTNNSAVESSMFSTNTTSVSQSTIELISE
ncbi:hypothetical protein JW824_11165 [bacterium]|nr:hypothetical protein [bacterium]